MEFMHRKGCISGDDIDSTRDRLTGAALTRARARAAAIKHTHAVCVCLVIRLTLAALL